MGSAVVFADQDAATNGAVLLSIIGGDDGVDGESSSGSGKRKNGDLLEFMPSNCIGGRGRMRERWAARGRRIRRRPFGRERLLPRLVDGAREQRRDHPPPIAGRAAHVVQRGGRGGEQLPGLGHCAGALGKGRAAAAAAAACCDAASMQRRASDAAVMP